MELTDDTQKPDKLREAVKTFLARNRALIQSGAAIGNYYEVRKADMDALRTALSDTEDDV